MNPQLHNNACQIHKSCYGTPSSITMGLQWSLLQYWPCNATRQFFNFRCMQSIESNIPVNPCVSLICSRRLMSLLFGLPKYISHNISFTSLTKASKHWIPVHSVILTYSLTLSTSDLYANIQIVAVHLCNGERLCLPQHWISFENKDHDYWERLQFEGTIAYAFGNFIETASLCIQIFLRSSHSTNNYVHLHDRDLYGVFFVSANCYFLLVVAPHVSTSWFLLHSCH